MFESNVEIVSDGTIINTKVLVDGVAMSGVRSIQIQPMDINEDQVVATIVVISPNLGLRPDDN